MLRFCVRSGRLTGRVAGSARTSLLRSLCLHFMSWRVARRTGTALLGAPVLHFVSRCFAGRPLRKDSRRRCDEGRRRNGNNCEFHVLLLIRPGKQRCWIVRRSMNVHSASWPYGFDLRNVTRHYPPPTDFFHKIQCSAAKGQGGSDQLVTCPVPTYASWGNENPSPSSIAGSEKSAVSWAMVLITAC